MGTISIAKYDSEQEQRERRKEEMKRQRVVLSLRKSGDIARLRFLLDLDPLIGVDYHFVFNPTNPSETIRAVCAREFDQPCHYCNLYKKTKNRDLVAGQHIALPAWLHSLSNPKASEDDQSYDEEQGYKILMVKRGSDAVTSLRSYYDAVGSITGCDWRYTRTGSGKDSTKYALTALPPPPLPLDELPETNVDDVMRLLAAAYPYVVDER